MYSTCRGLRSQRVTKRTLTVLTRVHTARNPRLLAPNTPLTLTITASPTFSPFTASLTCLHHLWPAAGDDVRRVSRR